MRQQSNDRRSRRTHQLLSDALAELLRSKRFESITVQEITERANVGRSTFYAHFTDKQDLLASAVRQMVAGLEYDEAGPRNTLAPSLGLFHHVAGHSEHYEVMARGMHLTVFLDVLQAELSVLFEERLAARLPADGTPRVPVPLLASMLAGMLITAVRTWLESGVTTSAQEANRCYLVAAEAALRAGLRPRSSPVSGPPGPP